MLKLEQVSLSYRVDGEEPVVAVEAVSTEIEPGELVMVYGPSGSGKSTLLQLSAGLLAPDDGRVLVNGRDISGLSAREAARMRLHELGFLAAFTSVLPAPAIENAALKLIGRRVSWKEAEEQVRPLLERLGMGEKLDRDGRHLSMGERQRVMIARALSGKPKLLLADEPTSNLDSRRSKEVLGVIRDLCHETGLAALLVTHDPQAAVVADRVHVLRDGQLMDCEPHELAVALEG
jgi:putative ABC transport system ATP-binding protein